MLIETVTYMIHRRHVSVTVSVIIMAIAVLTDRKHGK